MSVTTLATTAATDSAIHGLTAAWLASVIQPGERYAGIVLNLDAAIDGLAGHHLFLLPGEAVDVTWDEAVAWARVAGGVLPTRREQALLFANLQDQFKRRWYWSGEQYDLYRNYAGSQNFDSGYQYDYDKSSNGQARSVRRLAI